MQLTKNNLLPYLRSDEAYAILSAITCSGLDEPMPEIQVALVSVYRKVEARCHSISLTASERDALWWLCYAVMSWPDPHPVFIRIKRFLETGKQPPTRRIGPRKQL